MTRPPPWLARALVLWNASAQRRNPHLGRTFTRLVRRLESHPLQTAVTDPNTGKPAKVVLDGGALVEWLVETTLATPLIKYVPDQIGQLAEGNPTSIAAARLRAGLATAAAPGYVGYGLQFGVVCREYTPFDSERKVIAAGQRVFPRYPRSVLAQAPQLPFIFSDCRAWHVPPASPSARRLTRSRIPTLLLSGSFDAATSLRWTKLAASDLSNSTIVRLPGIGHYVLPESRCAQTVVASFLSHPQAPNTSCAHHQGIPQFVPPPNGVPSGARSRAWM